MALENFDRGEFALNALLMLFSVAIFLGALEIVLRLSEPPQIGVTLTCHHAEAGIAPYRFLPNAGYA